MAPMQVILQFSVKTQPCLPLCGSLPACPQPPPYKSASGIGYTSKNYVSKWHVIQLAIECTADTVNYLEYSYRTVEKHVQTTVIILEVYRHELNISK